MINQLLTVEPTDSGFIAKHHCTNPNGSLFGGQILAQSLMATSKAINTDDRFVHSLHAYFINRGDALSPVEYTVNNVREGNSFTAMSTVASQNSKDIFIASMSFQKQEDNGLNHVFTSADVSPPNDEDIERMQGYIKAAETNPELRFFASHRNDFFDVVTTRENPMMLYQDGSTSSEFWIKASEPLDTKDIIKHQACLLGASDMGILFSTIAPYKIDMKQTQIASIDHSVWLHDPHVDMNEWHLIKANSCWAGNSRSLVKADIYNQQGNLVATVTQEGLVRTRLLT